MKRLTTWKTSPIKMYTIAVTKKTEFPNAQRPPGVPCHFHLCSFQKFVAEKKLQNDGRGGSADFRLIRGLPIAPSRDNPE